MRPAVYGPGEKTLAAWPLNDGQELRLTSVWFKHRRFLDLRRWECRSGEWWPTTRGIRFNEALAGPLADLLREAAEGRAA